MLFRYFAINFEMVLVVPILDSEMVPVVPSIDFEMIPVALIILLRHQGPEHAPDAPQPVGLLCDPLNPPVLDIPTAAVRCLYVYTTREIQAAKSGTYGRE
jgi:hypothetical protein